MAENIEKYSFEEAITKLQEASDALKSGKLSLEESTEVYSKSIQLYNRCAEILKDAKQKIEVYKPENGEITEY